MNENQTTEINSSQSELLGPNILRMKDENDWRWYQIDGKNYLSVTTILDGFMEQGLKRWLTNTMPQKIHERKEETAKAGSEIHASVHLGVDDRFNALALTLEMETIKSEFIVKSLNGFAGQADRLVKMNDRLYLIDVKTGRFGPKAGAQMAAYKMALAEEGILVDGIGVVHIPRDGGEAKWFDYSKHQEDCEYAFCCAFDFFKFMNYKKLSDWPPQREKTATRYHWES